MLTDAGLRVSGFTVRSSCAGWVGFVAGERQWPVLTAFPDEVTLQDFVTGSFRSTRSVTIGKARAKGPEGCRWACRTRGND